MRAVSLSFFRFGSAWARFRALSRMATTPRALARVPDIGFAKVLGSGTGEGFIPIPNWSVYAILATWPDAETARRRVETAAVFQQYRALAVEGWTVFLEARSVRGAGWDRAAPFAPVAGDPRPAPVAVLTRATVRPGKAAAFWRRVPGIERVIPDHAEGLLFKIGLGEVPLLHQVTFSIWRDVPAMEAFAYSGPHRAAATDAFAKGWFSEDLFARFAVTGAEGRWDRTDPLARTTLAGPQPLPAAL